MRKVAVYGKGGIGKSTISSNVTAALSDSGIKVMQIGCDPKHDSTRMLAGGVSQETVLDYLKDVPHPKRKLMDIVEEGYKGCLCVEAGGPEPGIGCAGRGIISAFELLDDLGVNSIPLDIVLYDVLGDVVCGGFAVPLRNNYADTVYVVTSGEYMSIYAANNILRGTANYDPNRIGGLIFNSRGDEEERERVVRFSEAVGIPIVAEFSRSKEFMEAERLGRTVVETYPDSQITGIFRGLADTIVEGKRYTAKFLSESELEDAILGRSVTKRNTCRGIGEMQVKEKKSYTSRNVHNGEILHGCSFSGAASVTLSIDGLFTVLHSPRSCAQFTFQLVTNSIRRSSVRGNMALSSFADPMIHCTDMNESVMIFGGIEKLESDLKKIIKEGHKDIALITSCPSGIIGDDVESVIRRIKLEYPDVSIIPMVEDGNVRGDFMQGVIDASLLLMRSVAFKNVQKKNSVNVVGVKTLATNCADNSAFVENILNEMGIEANCNCVGNTSIESIKNVAEAKLSILITPDRFALMLRDFLVDEYDLEFARSVVRPGLNETRVWIREIGKYFGKEKEAEKVVASIEGEYSRIAAALSKDLKGRPAYVVGTQKDIGWILEAMKECGMNVQRAVIIDLSDHSKDLDLDLGYDVEIIKKEDFCKIIDDITERKPELLVTTYPIDLDIRTEQCFIPIAPDVGPYVGLQLAETWVKRLKAPVEEGWRKDVVRI
jgi:Nitrogenase subunit NifH (ATPase)